METSGLLEAIRLYDVDRVTRILFTDDGNTKITDDRGNTPLHYACYYKSTEITNKLIKAGFSVNVKNLNGETPLMFIFLDLNYRISKQKKRMRRIVEQLVQLILYEDKASVNEVNSSGNTALHLAVKAACYKNVSIECIQLMLKSDADTSMENKSKETPYNIAFNNSLRKLGEMLLFCKSPNKKPLANNYYQPTQSWGIVKSSEGKVKFD